MAQAILNEDIIIRLVIVGGVEVGNIPKGIGLERLRFDGEKVVDLAALNQIWVRNINGVFELHCRDIGYYKTVDDEDIWVGTCQLVNMAYADRNNLTLSDGVIRVKTPEELNTDYYNAQLSKLKTALRTKLYSTVGDLQDQHMQTLAFTCALIVYARQQPSALADFFDSIIDDIKDCFPLNRWQDILTQGGADLKAALQEYYTNLDILNGD